MSAFSMASAPPATKNRYFELLGHRVLGELLHERGVLGAVDVRVGRVGDGRAGQRLHELAVVGEARVVVADGQRGEVAVEVEDVLAADGVVDVRALRLLQVDDDVEAVHEDVLLQRRNHLLGRDLVVAHG
ncbi:MAG: hypothetical protein QM765_03865 [Myxococcales bacterium]